MSYHVLHYHIIYATVQLIAVQTRDPNDPKGYRSIFAILTTKMHYFLEQTHQILTPLYCRLLVWSQIYICHES